ncbi:hypothetical protein [Pseudomonas cerasi]
MTRKPAPKLPIPKATAKEVAVRTGVSKWTVSRLVPDAIRRLTTPWDKEHNPLYPGELQLRQSHRRS